MQTQQQRHVLAIEDNDKPLFGSGVENTVPYLLSDTFVFKAKKDGTLKKIDSTNNVAILHYKDGTTDVINLDVKMIKNSNGGFYLKSQLHLLLNEGEKFKANDILAKDDMYMSGSNKNDISYAMGRNTNVAIASSDLTYEDSSFVGSSFTGNMMSKMSDLVDYTFAPNSNIEYMAKKGQHIKTGDPLIIFENSFEDESVNEILAKLGTDFEETINSLSKNTLRSEYTGTIVDLNIYYNRDIEEFSPSIQKILKQYISKTKRVNNIIEVNSNNQNMNTLSIASYRKIEGNKIKSQTVEGIRIDFYIEHDDYLGVGDKIRYYSSCKTVISRVLPDDEMPYVESQGKDSHLDAVFSPLSLVSRMTTDINNAIYLGKCITRLKEDIRNIVKK